MGNVLTLALKDLRILVRDKFGLFWILVFPILFALFFGAIMSGAGGRGVAALKLAIIDEDQTDESRTFAARLKKSEALKVEDVSLADARDQVRKGDLVAFVVIPKGYGEKSGFFGGGDAPAIKVGIDPSRKAEEGYLQGLLAEASFGIMQDLMADPKKFQSRVSDWQASVDKATDMTPKQKETLKQLFGSLNEMIPQFGGKQDGAAGVKQGWNPVNIQTEKVAADAGNRPRSAFEISFPSSMLWAILGCVTAFSISIVSERIGGTYLRLQVSPLARWHILAGKGLACFLACSGVMLVLLLFAAVAFGVRLGNPLLLTLAIVSTSACFVGLMMFIATIGKTEQAVAGAGWAILMPFAMIGGAMIPLIAMPPWMITLSHASPIKWGIYALEGAIWRGFSFTEMLLPCGILVAIGVVCFALGTVLLRRYDR
jgi:ABC-2 type transport system permease protein